METLSNPVRQHSTAGVNVLGKETLNSPALLSLEALSFIVRLEHEFGERRQMLLRRRLARQLEINAGKYPDFLPATERIRSGDWQVAAPPKDLLDRRVEITGPPDRKMIINAMNSGANVYMADFEDACSPTWEKSSPRR